VVYTTVGTPLGIPWVVYIQRSVPLGYPRGVYTAGCTSRVSWGVYTAGCTFRVPERESCWVYTFRVPERESCWVYTPVPCWVCTTLYTTRVYLPGYTSPAPLPATVQALRYRRAQLAALTRTVVEVTVRDASLTVTRFTVGRKSYHHRFTVGREVTPPYRPVWDLRRRVFNTVSPLFTRSLRDVGERREQLCAERPSP